MSSVAAGWSRYDALDGEPRRLARGGARRSARRRGVVAEHEHLDVVGEHERAQLLLDVDERRLRPPVGDRLLGERRWRRSRPRSGPRTSSGRTRSSGSRRARPPGRSPRRRTRRRPSHRPAAGLRVAVVIVAVVRALVALGVDAARRPVAGCGPEIGSGASVSPASSDSRARRPSPTAASPAANSLRPRSRHRASGSAGRLGLPTRAATPARTSTSAWAGGTNPSPGQSAHFGPEPADPRRQLDLHAVEARQVHRVVRVQAAQLARDRVEVRDDLVAVERRAQPVGRCVAASRRLRPPRSSGGEHAPSGRSRGS